MQNSSFSFILIFLNSWPNGEFDKVEFNPALTFHPRVRPGAQIRAHLIILN